MKGTGYRERFFLKQVLLFEIGLVVLSEFFLEKLVIARSLVFAKTAAIMKHILKIRFCRNTARR